MSLGVLEKICNYFNCDIGDVMGFEKWVCLQMRQNKDWEVIQILNEEENLQ